MINDYTPQPIDSIRFGIKGTFGWLSAETGHTKTHTSNFTQVH